MKFLAARIILSVVAFAGSAFAGEQRGQSLALRLNARRFRTDEARRRGRRHSRIQLSKFVRDSYYGSRQTAATRAGLLWGAYHFGDATDPLKQAEFFSNTVASNFRGPSAQPVGCVARPRFRKERSLPRRHHARDQPRGSLSGSNSGPESIPAFMAANTGSAPSERLRRQTRRQSDPRKLLALDRETSPLPGGQLGVGQLAPVAIHRRRQRRSSPPFRVPHPRCQHRPGRAQHFPRQQRSPRRLVAGARLAPGGIKDKS